MSLTTNGQKFTDVILPVCPVRTATGLQYCMHHTLSILSQLPAANRVFSLFTAMSVISEDAPRRVDRRRPSRALQIFTKKSSAP